MALGLHDFAGTWALTRRIDDRRNGRQGHFDGCAAFEPAGPTLLYQESGTLHLDGTEMAARQSHVWRQEGNRLCVTFSDGRPFHAFELGVTTAQARHECGRDVYVVSYDFGRWPHWTAEWDVTGPAKSYLLQSTYRPD